MERGLSMVLHSLIIGFGVYLFMIFVLKQQSIIAEDRSILFAALVLIYMILFGHKLPNSINKNIINL